MRWSAGVFVALIGLVLVAGPACRNNPTQNNDRNRPPETYLSAAPADSIQNGGMVQIPHRFRANWAGADVDGEVVGFYVAVTETTVDQATGRPFRLPPPKPQDYRFTTSNESLFVFTVLEGRGNDRQHALYVYSVDNQGKVDPTPAVTHFVARDRTLPSTHFDLAQATGTVFDPGPNNTVIPVPFERALTDSFELPLHAPIDTIASGSSVHFAWQGIDPDFGSFITGYLYKLTETEFVRVDSTVKSVDYGTGTGPNGATIPIGLNTFRIRSIDEAGGTTQPDAVRRFYVNFSPDTWLAGPDPALLTGHLLEDANGTYFMGDTLTTGSIDDFPGNPMTDTLNLLPSERPPTDGLNGRPKTIVERRQLLNRIIKNYIRSENDTVAYGSLLLERIGGSDRDSPYRVPGGDPSNPSRVYQSSGPNGSPVSFKGRVVYKRVNGSAEEPPFSTPFPNIDPFDPLSNPNILFTLDQVTRTGQGILQVQAVDGDRTSDFRIGDVIRDSLSTALASKIFKMWTNFKPGMLIFSPTPDSIINPGGNRFNVVIRVTDPDPDPSLPRVSALYNSMFFEIRARIYARNASPSPEEGWQDPVRGSTFLPEAGQFYPYTAPISLEVAVPDDLPTGPAYVEIEVVDNSDRGDARIISVKVPIYWRATS